MFDFYTLMHVLQALGISLGFGVSTAAITLFAAGFGSHDDTLHRVMHVLYRLLRVAMGLILATTLYLTVVLYSHMGVNYFDTYTLGVWTCIGVLYLNALLMGVHKMPMKIGPGLQGASWYALAITVALSASVVNELHYVLFLLLYTAFCAFMISMLNRLITRQKERGASTN